METLRVWKKFDKPPKDALKPIAAGRLKGKSDINPQWRMKAITEAFGPVGIGWKYTIDKVWLENGEPPEVTANAIVTVWHKENGEWSEPFQGIGGSSFVTKESRGVHTSDEAYKMAVTDALSVAFKALGVAAEVYMGNWDGTKYRETTPTGGNGKDEATITYKQVDELTDLVKSKNRTVGAFCKHLEIDKLENLPASRFMEAKNIISPAEKVA